MTLTWLKPFEGKMKLALAASVLVMVAACGNAGHKDAAPAAGGPGAQAERAIPVDVVKVELRQAPSIRELSGRATAYAEAEIRPQVTGLIQKRLFTEGQQVNAGDALYKIENSEYLAAYNSAKANLKSAESAAEIADETAKRYKSLVEINAISKQSYDEAAANARGAAAAIDVAKAALETARINLSRTTITAPISGQIGRSSVTPGALVTSNQAEALATIRQLDPIFVDMTASSASILQWKRQVSRGEIVTDENATVPVAIKYQDGETYAHKGQLEFSEVSVDEAAGTVIVRAVVPNPEGYILPGMFLRATFAAGNLDKVVAVPQRAVEFDAKGNPSVYVVSADSRATKRPVQLEGEQDGMWVVKGGLQPGEMLVVSGFQSVHEGVLLATTQTEARLAFGGASSSSALKSE